MSTPRTLALPPGVEAGTVATGRGSFAVHAVRVPDPRGHLLLVPGWTGSKEDFTQALPLLAAGGLDVTAYDQRGQFETPAGDAPDFSLAALAADAGAVAAACSPAPSHLLGHSFGGLVAQRAVVDDPSAWASLSLLCTGPGALGETPGRPLRRLNEALGTLSMERVHELREAAEGAVRPADIADFLRRRFTANDPAALRAVTMHLLESPDVVDEVAATGVPVWVGRGADDDAWPHADQDAMARRLGTTVHVIDGAAHSPGVEDPRGLADAWLPFLQQAVPS